jgi:CubicO group peptidase (beta-lactamase class C family)
MPSCLPRAAFRLAAVFVLLLSAPAWAAPCPCEALAKEEWPMAAPEAAGVDPVLLDAAAERARTLPGTAMHSLLVLRGGKLVFERYFTAPDDEWGHDGQPVAFTADTPHQMMSVTKTVVALLVGIARDRGMLADLDAPILSYLPEYADLRSPERDRITLRHVLMMGSGLAWNEWLPFRDPANTFAVAYHAPDPYRYLLSRPLKDEPGTRFTYNSFGSGLLVAALRDALGKPIDDFARTALAEPLGVTSFGWEKFRNGDLIGGWGLNLRPRDMAKLGQLLLDGGIWRGKRLVSASWVAEMMTPRLTVDRRRYGYQMWVHEETVDGRPLTWISALGRGGQKIHVVPALDLVVVMTAGYYNDDRQDTVPDELLTRYVLPAALRGPGKTTP